VRSDHPLLLEAYGVAGRYGVPVVVHQEAAYVAELERALVMTPGTTFVWAHAGHGPAATLRSLLVRYPNLYADLAARTPWLRPGTVLTDGDGTLRPGAGRVVGASDRRFGHARRTEAVTDDAHGEVAEERRAEEPAGQHKEASLADRREQALLHQILERLDEACGNLPLELDPDER